MRSPGTWPGCLEKHFDVRGLTTEWRSTHERALELCRTTGNRRGEAVLLRGLVEVTTWTSAAPSGPAMATLYERSSRLLRMFEDLGEPRGMADALVNLAWGLVARGEEDKALSTAERALALARDSAHLGGQARARHVMGIACGRSRIEEAIGHLSQALGTSPSCTPRWRIRARGRPPRRCCRSAAGTTCTTTWPTP